jgi:hypothetical protein
MNDSDRSQSRKNLVDDAQGWLQQNALSSRPRHALAPRVNLKSTIDRFHRRGDCGTLVAVGFDPSPGLLVESGLRPCNPEHQRLSR